MQLIYPDLLARINRLNDGDVRYKMVNFPNEKSLTIKQIIENADDSLQAELTIGDYISFIIGELTVWFKVNQKMETPEIEQVVEMFMNGICATTGMEWIERLTLEDWAVFANYARQKCFNGYTKILVPGVGYKYSETQQIVRFPHVYGRFDADTLMEWVQIYLECRDATRAVCDTLPQKEQQMITFIEKTAKETKLIATKDAQQDDKNALFAMLNEGGKAAYDLASAMNNGNQVRRGWLREWKENNANLFAK